MIIGGFSGWPFPLRLERFAIYAFASLMLALLAGCGGSSSPSTSPTPTPSPAPGTPAVTAKSTTYSTQGAPFEAISSGAGTVFVSINANGTPGSETGVQVFDPNGSGGLQSSCVNSLPTTLLSEGAGSYNLGSSMNEAQIEGGIGPPGGRSFIMPPHCKRASPQASR